MDKPVNFTKMEGLGNDYIYVNVLQCPIDDPSAFSRRWSDRRTGIGSDGLILIGGSERADFSMRIFNADGSEARMCGNGARCVGRYLHDKGLTDKTVITLETLSGIKTLTLHPDEKGQVHEVTVGMGPGVPMQVLLPGGETGTAATVLSSLSSSVAGTVSGTMITWHPASCPALTPLGLSSNTMQSSGRTPSFSAPRRKTSGAGFECSGSVPVTEASKSNGSPAITNSFLIVSSVVEEQSAFGIPFSFSHAESSRYPFFTGRSFSRGFPRNWH